MPAHGQLGAGGSLGQARWVYHLGSEGCFCMEGWLAGSQPWAPAHTSEVGVSIHPVFVQLPSSAGLTLWVPWLSPCHHWREGCPGMRRHRGLACSFPGVCRQPLPAREGTRVPLSVQLATSSIPAEAGAALLPGRTWGREDNLLPTALLPCTLALGSETSGIGKPLILLLAALVWYEQGD